MTDIRWFDGGPAASPGQAPMVQMASKGEMGEIWL